MLKKNHNKMMSVLKNPATSVAIIVVGLIAIGCMIAGIPLTEFGRLFDLFGDTATTQPAVTP